jgi:hypothetical protein
MLVLGSRNVFVRKFLIKYFLFILSATAAGPGLEQQISQEEERVMTEVADLFKGYGPSPAAEVEISVTSNFKTHLREWQEIRNSYGLETLLTELRTVQNLGQIAVENQAKLKELRKKMDVLRRFFELFTKEAAAPKDLARFVKRFGGLNDAIAAGELELIRESADATQEALRKLDIKTLSTRFKPFKKKHVNKRLSFFLQRISEFSSKKEIPLEQFHRMRKDMKILVRLLQETPSGTFDQDIRLLQRVLDLMGELNDLYIITEIHSPELLKDRVLYLQKRFRKEVKNFVSEYPSTVRNIRCILGR